MKTWCIEFVRRDGKKEYREYPQQSQFKTYSKLMVFLQHRQFLLDYRVNKIVLNDLRKIKYELANSIGSLIYN
jgi:hypothetical protein